MMKRASMFALAAMFGGFAWASAQDVTVETDEKPEGQEKYIALQYGDGLNTYIAQCGGSFLGIVGDEVKKETVQELNLPGEYGALINEVVSESAAEKAGLQKKDVIVGYNGTRVESMAQLRRLLQETPAGRSVDLTIVRNGSEQHVNAEIGSRPMPKVEMFFGDDQHLLELRDGLKWDDEEFKEEMGELRERMKELKIDLSDMKEDWPEGMEGQFFLQKGEGEDGSYFTLRGLPNGFGHFTMGRPKLGVTVQSVSDQLAEYFKLGEGVSGALISEVHEGTPAQRDGLHAGDVILSVDGEHIEQVGDLPRIISAKEGVIEVNIVRDGAEQTLWIDLGTKADTPEQKEKGMLELQMPEDGPGLSFNGRS